MTVTVVIPLIIILVFGLPHGAADGILAYRLFNAKLNEFLKFLTVYVAIGVLVILFWIFFPLVALGLFLIISFIHFGMMDTERSKNHPYRPLRAFVHGGTAILIIPTAHFNEVKVLFDLLVESDTTLIFRFIYITLIFWGSGLLALIFFRHFEDYFVLLELLITITFSIFLPPLWGFAIYFCVIHSPRHFQNLWRAFGKKYSQKETMICILVFSLFSLFIIFVAMWVINTSNLTNSLIRATFIGLAAFTAPHFLFIDFFGAIKRFKPY